MLFQHHCRVLPRAIVAKVPKCRSVQPKNRKKMTMKAAIIPARLKASTYRTLCPVTPARFGFGLDNSFATSFGHLGPTPQSGSVIRKLGDANGAFISSAIGPRSNLSILVYCIPADIQPSHCGLLCIDEVRKERGHGNPRRCIELWIYRHDRAAFSACLLGREGIPFHAAIEGAPK